jgi:uncharacterized protein YjbI with pentapeptide repeats
MGNRTKNRPLSFHKEPSPVFPQLTDIVFDGTLKNCSFENCCFSEVAFQNATLIETFFKNQSLKRIRFIDCKADILTYAFLKRKSRLDRYHIVNTVVTACLATCSNAYLLRWLRYNNGPWSVFCKAGTICPAFLILLTPGYNA